MIALLIACAVLAHIAAGARMSPGSDFGKDREGTRNSQELKASRGRMASESPVSAAWTLPASSFFLGRQPLSLRVAGRPVSLLKRAGLRLAKRVLWLP